MTLAETLTGAPLVASAALLARVSGAAARGSDAVLPVRAVGWVLAGLAAWLAVAAAGAWTPLWPPVAVALLLSVFDGGSDRRFVRCAGDIVLPWLAASMSLPRLSWGPLLVAVSGLLLVGVAADLLIENTRPWVRGLLLLSPLLVWKLLVVASPGVGHRLERVGSFLPSPARAPHFAIGVLDAGEPVELDTGAVAWLSRPSSAGPHPGAVLFHGADADGARQPSAVFLQHALREAGYLVLSVDHPGYGASPRPSLETGLEAWDPLPSDLAALRLLESYPAVRGAPIVIGHSMGATDALRVIGAWPRVEAAILLGATVNPTNDEENRMLDARFQSDRGMDDEGVSLDPAVVGEIRRRFYNNDDAALALESHPPIVFGEFVGEFENIRATRDRLFALIPGAKIRWEIPSSHHFSANSAAGLLLGDYRVLRRVAVGFERLREQRHPGSGVPLGARFR